MATPLSEEEVLRQTWARIKRRIPYESGNYPYVAARVKAKKAALYPQDTYARLLQMEIPQIARFLGEGPYKDEILALGAQVRGVDLVERATANHLPKGGRARDGAPLAHLYSPPLLGDIEPRTEPSRLFHEFVRREVDILNLRTLLRVWRTKSAVDRPVFLDGGLEL